MILKAPTMFVAVALTAVLTAAATVAIFETPWNALPGVFAGMVITRTGPLVAPGHVATEPDVARLAVIDAPPAALDTPTVIELPESTPVRTLSASEPNEAIDYARLNTNVRVVTTTLDRFNRKLLRMIAQAKAAQTGRPAGPSAVDTGATVALDIRSTSPAPAVELNQ